MKNMSSKYVSFSCRYWKENINQYSIMVHATTTIKFLNYMPYLAIMVVDSRNETIVRNCSRLTYLTLRTLKWDVYELAGIWRLDVVVFAQTLYKNIVGAWLCKCIFVTNLLCCKYTEVFCQYSKYLSSHLPKYQARNFAIHATGTVYRQQLDMPNSHFQHHI